MLTPPDQSLSTTPSDALRRGGRGSAGGNAVEKAMRVLEAATRTSDPQSLGEIAAEARVTKTTAYRVLSTLADTGFVIRHARQGYVRGPRMRAIGHTVIADKDAIDDVLADLVARTGQTAHFGVMTGETAVYTHKLEAELPYKMNSQIGGSFDLHSTAIGKAILSHLPIEEVRAIALKTGLPRHSDRTITDLPALERELDIARERGFAMDDEENERTIRCVGAASVSAAGEIYGAVCIAAVVFLADESAMLEWAAAAVEASERIAAILGGTAPHVGVKITSKIV